MFKVGSYYKQRNGVVALVTQSGWDGLLVQVESVLLPGGVWANGGGSRKQSDGSYYCSQPGQERDCDLLPGEVDQHGNPISEAPAVTFDDVQALASRLVALSGDDFCNEYAKQHFGTDLIYQIEAMPEKWASFVQSVDAMLTAPAPSIKPKRAPLAYFTEQQERAIFDRFAEFEVSRGGEDSEHAIPFGRVCLDGPGAFKAPQQKL
jgi:hypothetical protein